MNIYYRSFQNISVFNISLFIFFISLSIRGVYLFYLTDPYMQPIEDQKIYHMYAYTISQSGFLHSAIEGRPILLPSILAILYKFSDPEFHFLIARLFLIIISALSITLFFINAFLYFKKKSWALLTSLFLCFYPPSIFYSTRILTENLSIVLLLLSSILLLLIIKNKENLIYHCLLGFTLGLAALSRSAFLLLPIFIIVSIYFFTYIYKIEFNTSIKKSFIIILTFIITLTPWTMRNYYVYDSFVPTTTRTGYMAWLSNHDLNEKIVLNGGYIKNNHFLNILSEVRSKNDSVETSKILFSKSLEEIKNNKFNFSIAVINRGINYLNFRPNPYKENYTINDLIMFIFWTPIFIFFLISLFKRKTEYEIIFLTIILYSFLVHLPFWGISRFRFPTDPYFVLLAFNIIIPYFFYKKDDNSN